jgi:hypothetical protein
MLSCIASSCLQDSSFHHESSQLEQDDGAAYYEHPLTGRTAAGDHQLQHAQSRTGSLHRNAEGDVHTLR